LKSGVLNLKKEQGFTSHDAVAKVRRLFGTKKVGHTGTLDPEATGVLPILIGNAVKACDLMPEETKVYRATVRFGLESDTEDIWGTILKTDPCRPTEEEIREAMSTFSGEYFQIPPMVSAVKVGGKKLYEYAREGKDVERAARRVFIYNLTLLSFTPEEASFRAEVSKGTYIRTLLVDLCRKAGVLGVMSSLCREKSGVFSLENTVTLEELESMDPVAREESLLPTEELFFCYPVFSLPPFFDRLIANGCQVLTKKIAAEHLPLGQKVRLYRAGAFFALGEVILTDGEKKLKKIKDFPPDP